MYLYIGTGDNNDVCLMKQSGDLFTTTEIEFQNLLNCGEITCNEDEFKKEERKMYEAYSITKALAEINDKIYDARDEAEKAETALEQYIDDPDNADDKLMYRAENALEKVREAMELLLDATNDIEGEYDEEE